MEIGSFPSEIGGFTLLDSPQGVMNAEEEEEEVEEEKRIIIFLFSIEIF
jgi:hypothetical protein